MLTFTRLSRLVTTESCNADALKNVLEQHHYMRGNRNGSFKH